jgi:FKBP-type peptidyl-prolyl cis-trans isomerase
MHISSFRLVYFLLLIALFLPSCKDTYPGFSQAEEGIYYRLLTIGEREKCCQFGDYVTVDIRYATLNDSVFFDRPNTTFQIVAPSFQGSIDKCLTMMCLHDSAQFIISASDFYAKTLRTEMPTFLKESDKLKVSVKVLNLQTPEEYQFERHAFAQWIDDLGEYEKVLLQQFIQQEQIDIPAVDGVYYIEQEHGSGNQIVTGDTITIHYEGYFLNGMFFDSTRQRNEPLQFVYGHQWQVIPGLEKILSRMRNGTKALVIIPSEHAFGARGSVRSIVPPYTPVAFEIELINVK